MAMPKPHKKPLILEAAAQIVADQGAAHLTIDAVAAAAGISKGGVLYHFPSKQALLEGMLERLLEEIAASNAELRTQHASADNPALVARIIEQHNQTPIQKAMERAILAAAAEDPNLLAPAHTEAANAFEDAAAGSDRPELSWVVLLAVEGLRFLEMLKLSPLSTAERERVHHQLLELASSSPTKIKQERQERVSGA